MTTQKIISMRGKEYTRLVERVNQDGKELVYFENGYENYPEPKCFFVGVDGTLFTIGGALVTSLTLESLQKIYHAYTERG
jgi:hypothetical protein